MTKTIVAQRVSQSTSKDAEKKARHTARCMALVSWWLSANLLGTSMKEREALKLAANINPFGSVENARARDAAIEALAQPEREIDPSTTFDEVAKGLQVSRMAIAALDALTIEQRRSINEPLLKAQLFLKAAARVFKEALAQPEQIQPSVHPNTHQPEPEAAPVAKNEGGRITWMIDDWPQNCLLYTHTPPQRTWVGLDNDDLVWIYSNSDKVGQAISNTEAKLKEKNK